MSIKPQVKIDENGFVLEMSLGGNIGGVDVELPQDTTDYIENFRAYQLIEGKLIKNEGHAIDLIEEKEKKQLRRLREAECFKIVNRGILWYNTLTEEQRQELDVWYRQWLDVTETLEVPQEPIWLNRH